MSSSSSPPCSCICQICIKFICPEHGSLRLESEDSRDSLTLQLHLTACLNTKLCFLSSARSREFRSSRPMIGTHGRRKRPAAPRPPRSAQSTARHLNQHQGNRTPHQRVNVLDDCTVPQIVLRVPLQIKNNSEATLLRETLCQMRKEAKGTTLALLCTANGADGNNVGNGI